MQIVRCNSCGRWIGKESDLSLETVNEPDIEYCPVCHDDTCLMDVDYGCSFNDCELEKLWKLFGDVPVNDDDGIQEEFLGFPEGTDRIEILHWFDEMYSKGVAVLMYEGGIQEE